MALAYLVPNAASASAWTNTFAEVDDDFNNPDDAATIIVWDGVNDSQALFNLSSMPSATVINSVSVYFRAQGEDSTVQIRTLFRIDGVTYTGTYWPQDGSWATGNPTVYFTHPGTGAPFTVADLNGAIAGVSGTDTGGAVGTLSCTSITVVVDYVALPVPIGAARDVASRYLNTFRRPTSVVEVVAPLRWADVEIGDTIRMSHFAGETPEDEGWGYEAWEGRLFVVLASAIDLDALVVTLRLFDLRDYLTSFWDTAISEESPSVFGQGVARLDSGATRTYARDGFAYVENAAVAAQGSKQVSEVGDDIEKQDTYGLLLEAEGTNIQEQSSFVNGETGWTSAGEGSNGSAIATDTADLLFDSEITPNSIEFTAGNPIHVADLTFIGTATSSITANTIVTGSFDHKDDTTNSLWYTIQRATSDYWRNSDSTWQAGLTWNAMTASASHARYATNQIDIGANARTLQLGFGIPTSSGVAGQINHLYHAQIEFGTYPTSRIVTGTSSVTRSADNLSLSSSLHKRVWPVDQGTAWFQFRPEWASADIAVVRELMNVFHDASNLTRVFYNGANGTLVFRRRVAGVNYSASIAASLSRDTLYTVAVRWTGEEGEHDLDPYTLSIFLDGVKGTDQITTAWGSLVADATFYWGQDSNNLLQADAFFRHVRVSPFVLTDEEIADLP